jgi:SNF2 family DNA or RNA helicase
MDQTQTETASTQTDEPMVDDKSVQTEADLGTKENPLSIDNDDDALDDHGAISGDEEMEPEPTVPDDDKFFFGTAFEKVEEFNHHLDDMNPWHEDLQKPLFPSQIIGFRWMATRHLKGGGLVGDKVGYGKVLGSWFCIILTLDIPNYQLYPLAQRICQAYLIDRQQWSKKSLPTHHFQCSACSHLAQHTQQ